MRIKDGTILCGTHGNGPTVDDAIKDYSNKISGKLIVFDAYGENRKQISVPILI